MCAGLFFRMGKQLAVAKAQSRGGGYAHGWESGIRAGHSMVCDLKEPLPLERLHHYATIDFCGAPEYLMKRIRRTKFAAPLKRFAEEGGIYFSFRAGSIITTENMRSGMKLTSCILHVHCGTGKRPGTIDLSSCPQALLVTGHGHRSLGKAATGCVQSADGRIACEGNQSCRYIQQLASSTETKLENSKICMNFLGFSFLIWSFMLK